MSYLNYSKGKLARRRTLSKAPHRPSWKPRLEILESRLCLDAMGPRIIAVTDAPFNLRTDTLNTAAVTFDEAIDFNPMGGGSFTVEDVMITGPNGVITPTGITSLGSNQFEISFASQAARGTYTVQVGPQIQDLAGNFMDQDQDGNQGEPGEDIRVFSFGAYDADTVFTLAQTIAAGNTTYEGQDIAVIGATVTIDGAHSFESLHLIGNAAVTHSAGSVGGLNVTVEDAIVDASSRITADGRGHAGRFRMSGQGAGAGGTASNGFGAGGGSYGSVGGSSGGAIYGSATEPTDLGSSGGAGTTNTLNSVGGAGGGAIRLIVSGMLTLDGRITANGMSGSVIAGGGAGGSIWVTTGTLTGSGTLTANGGAGVGTAGGGGGGGRIAVYYSSSPAFTGFTGSTTTGGSSGGAGASGGSTGTVGFINQTLPGGHLHVYTTFGPNRDGSMTFGAATIHNGATFRMPGTATLTAGNLTVEATGRMTADGQGRSGQFRTIGLGSGAGGSATNGGGGGGYGGTGGSGFNGGAGGAIFGSAIEPTELGSSGGAATTNTLNSVGGAGGGAIRLIVSGTLTLDGQITANGVSGSSTAGGGAGGSIWVTTGTLTGAGTLKANGGNGIGTGGGGGGGRIAVYSSSTAGFTGFTGSTATGGGIVSGAAAGSAGTVGFIDESLAGGHLHVYTTFGPNRDGSMTFGAVTIHNDATFRMPGTATLTAGNLTVEATGRMTADGQGRSGQFRTIGLGSGAGGSATNGGGGGGYGDTGGGGFNGGAGGAIYGSAIEPTELGSSGGAAITNTLNSVGGAGGGAIRLIVSGTLTLNGQITANGVSGTQVAGGGSGGSIWVTTGTLSGAGTLTANGGNGVGTGGGGGGGGRIAVYSSSTSGFTGFTGSTATGGGIVSGAAAGSAGTVGFIDETLAGGHLHVYTTFGLNRDQSMTFGAVTIHNGATFRMPGTATLTAGNLTVEATGRMTADGQGQAGRFRTTGLGAGAGGSTSFGAGGGGYGGTGGGGFGGAVGGAIYGSAAEPTDLGSSGGAGTTNTLGSVGGAGGGAIRLIVSGTLMVDGQITAHGVSGTQVAGGGAGGSIWITSGILTGGGLICADGGAGRGAGGGGGGGGAGGRIALFYGLNTFTGEVCVDAGGTTGAGSGAGAAGTIHQFQTNQPPTADAGGPYTAIVNGAILLDGTGSSDPEQSSTTLIYAWDLDGDSVFGEFGADAEQGDETGSTPTFSTIGLPAGSPVTVRLRVTDTGGFSNVDTATIHIVYASDLTILPGSITFSPNHPDADELVIIHATVTNQGLATAANVGVAFYDFGTLLSTTTIASLAPGETVIVASAPVSFSESFRLIRVAVDPDQAIVEGNETNNEASQVLQVGDPDITVVGARIVVGGAPVSGFAGQPVIVPGDAFYDFITVPGIEDFPVQGGAVSVTVQDLSTGEILGRFTGSHSDGGGNFGQSIIAPSVVGTYRLILEVTDGTLTDQFQTTLDVSASTLAPLPSSPPSGSFDTTPPGGGGTGSGSGTPTLNDGVPQPGDVYVFSQDIVFSAQPEHIGDTIYIIAFIHYRGEAPVEDVPVTISDVFPVGGVLQTVTIASFLVDFEASPTTSSYVIVSIPWTNTADGPHIIHVGVEPAHFQFTGNDRASRIIGVGFPPDFLELDKDVTLLVDADDNGIASTGDTLEYTITYANTGVSALMGTQIFDDYDESLLQAPHLISDGGIASTGVITWNIGTLAAGANGTLSYQVNVMPAAQFPGGRTLVTNTVLLDTNETPPIAAFAEIEVLGDTIPPETVATLTPPANAAGWNHTDVDVFLTATDNLGGSGVSRILFSIDGGPVQTILGSSASFTLTDEGVHTVTFQAVDVAGNFETPKSIEVKIDKTLPVPGAGGGPFTLLEGSSILLDGSDSQDALSGVQTIAWALDGDGQFDDGSSPIFIGIDDLDEYKVYVKVVDRAGNIAIAETTISVLNVDPVIDNLAANSIIEGGTVHLTGTYHDDGTLDTHQLTINWGERDLEIVTVSGGTFDIVHPYLDDNPSNSSTNIYKIVVTLTDDDTGKATASTETMITNAKPLIVSLSATSVNEGGIVHLAGTYRDDGTQDTHTLTIDWGEGDLEIVTVNGGTFDITHPYLDDNPSNSPTNIYKIVVTLTDDDTGKDTASTETTITNEAPTIIALSNSSPDCGNAVFGESVSVTGTFFDIGTLDSHSVLVNWGDGTTSTGIVSELGGSGSFNASHVFTTGGVFNIKVTLTDDDMGEHTLTTTAVVMGVRLTEDGVLQIVGTEGRDHVNILLNEGSNAELRVHAHLNIPDGLDGSANGGMDFSFDSSKVRSIYVDLCGDDDHLNIHHQVTINAWVDAGAGDDHVNTGGGNDTIFGGDGKDVLHAGEGNDVVRGEVGNDNINGGGGNDLLLAGDGDDFVSGDSGRDFIIGGSGADRLVGNAQDDILVAGFTDHDVNDLALLAILAEWSLDNSYLSRVNNIKNGLGLAAGFRLDGNDGVLQTVYNDMYVDTLTGSSSQDWFFANQVADNAGPLDKVTDLAGNETLNDTDF